MANLVSGWTDKGKIYLVERIGEEIKLRALPARYSFFVTGLDDEDRADIGRDNNVKGVSVDAHGYTRVDCRGHYERRDLIEVLEQAKKRNGWNIEILEGDVSPLRRLLSDVPSLEIDPDPRCLFLDIETDSRRTFEEARSGQARILSWAVCDSSGEFARSSVLEADADSSERILLEELFEVMKGFDCILAWYGSSFDFDVIQSRAFALGFHEILWHRWTWLDHLEVFKQHNSLASGDEKMSFALDHVANYLLGEGKMSFDSSKTWEAWVRGGESREELRRYNERDTALLPRIEEKSGYLALHFAVCQICRVFPDTNSLSSTAQGDGFMLRLGDEHGIRWKTRKRFDESPEPFKGAYVMEPERLGAIDNVHVADFAGLYPSIMRTFNMSPDTKLNHFARGSFGEEEFCQLPERETYFRTDEEGMFKIALDQLVAKRAEYSEMMKKETPGSPEHKKFQRLSQAFKVVANSFYGIIGSPFSRFFDAEIAEGVTQTGKWLIQTVISEAKKEGLDPFYGDTDSVFVSGDADKFRALVNRLNTEWGERLEPWGIEKHFIDLDFEKTFRRVIMITAKRYVGAFLMYKGKEVPPDAPPEVKGVEFNRGDSIKLARVFQKEVIDRLLELELPTAETIRELIEEWKARVYRGEFELEDIIMSQSLSKPLKEYKDPLPTHVRVAHILKERGEPMQPGSRVYYVVIPQTDKEDKKLNPVPVADIESLDQVDRAYYWEKRVYPPVERVVEKVYPTIPWKESTAEKRARRQEMEGQMVLFDPFASTKGKSTGKPRVRKRKPKVETRVSIHLQERPGGENVIKAIKAIAEANPGDHSLTVIVHNTIHDGQMADVMIDANMKVSNSVAMKTALERVIDEGDFLEGFTKS